MAIFHCYVSSPEGNWEELGGLGKCLQALPGNFRIVDIAVSTLPLNQPTQAYSDMVAQPAAAGWPGDRF